MLPGHDDAGEEYVLAVVKLKICEDESHHHTYRPDCDGLHLCKFFLLCGRCEEYLKGTCKYDHEIDNLQNGRHLEHDLCFSGRSMQCCLQVKYLSD